MKKTTKICRFCKTEIPADAKVCPNCQKKQGGHGCLVVLGVVLVIGILGSVFSRGDSTPETATAASEAGAVIETKAETLAEAAVTSIEASVQETVMETEEENVPKEYRTALKKAETYVKMMHMSKDRLYDQLTSEYGEKYSPEAAQYAVSHL